jgi:predicted dehydrogenase
MSPADIVIFDIKDERVAAAAAKYPGLSVAQSFEKFAQAASAYIVAVNTPAHHTEIDKLARFGARRVLLESGTPSILSEKPLAQNVVYLKQIRAVGRRYPDLRIHTALVIAFSPARKKLIELRDEKGLVLREFTGSWGKNRAVLTEKRPTAGDRVDELIHMLEFGLGLLPEIDYVELTAKMGYLSYVNEAAQREAHLRDSSFPLRPDNSTHLMLRAAMPSGTSTRMHLESSFTKAKQVRNVEGVFTRPDSDEPGYAFAVEFDQKGADHLTVTELRSNTVTEEVLPCDKLCDLAEAFLRSARGEATDPRLASIEWAGFFVHLMDAVEKSSGLELNGRWGRQRVLYKQPDQSQASTG